MMKAAGGQSVRLQGLFAVSSLQKGVAVVRMASIRRTVGRAVVLRRRSGTRGSLRRWRRAGADGLMRVVDRSVAFPNRYVDKLKNARKSVRNEINGVAEQVAQLNDPRRSLECEKDVVQLEENILCLGPENPKLKILALHKQTD